MERSTVAVVAVVGMTGPSEGCWGLREEEGWLALVFCFDACTR
jgi:hypothetical protein